jgi:hypothetical protein
MVNPRFHSILGEGVAVGVIGAGLVGAWFLIIDTVAGRPFFTPAILGAAVFYGLRDPSTVTIGVQTVLAYTLLHIVSFIVVGLAVAIATAEARKTPHVVWLLVEFFIVFEVGFLGVVALAFTPLLAELAWINVALGNLIAASGMGYYLWRVHGASASPGKR